MNGEEIEEPSVKLKIKDTRRRRKRDVGDSDLGREKGSKRQRGKKSNSTIVSNTNKYGCPPKFERVTEYICLRYGTKEDMDYSTGKTVKKYLVADFETAKLDCNDDRAKLLYFSNSDEATKIWKWLGKKTFLFFIFKGNWQI